MIRMAEVYAGYSSYTDDQFGRLIDYLESIGELDNTLIVWLSDNGASGEGGPNGSVNENKVMNGVPDDLQGQLQVPRRARLAGDVQPLLDRLGVRVQHARQDVQAPHLGGRRRRPDGRALAQGHQGQGREPPPVHARQRRRPDRLRVPRYRAARDRQGLRAAAARGHELQVQLRRRQGEDAEAEPVLRDARHPGDLARRLEGRRAPRGRPVRPGGTSPRTSGRCTTSTRTAPSATTSPTSTPSCSTS